MLYPESAETHVGRGTKGVVKRSNKKIAIRAVNIRGRIMTRPVRSDFFTQAPFRREGQRRKRRCI